MLQRHVHKLLQQSSSSTEAMVTLSRRLGSHFDIEVGPVELDALQQLWTRALHAIPRFLQLGLMRCTRNAWNIASRYGEPSAVCRWCKVVHGDTLKHYLVCTVIHEAMKLICPGLRAVWCSTPHPPLVHQLPPSALGIGVTSAHWIQFIIIWHDFLHHCYSIAKHSWFDEDQWFRAFASRRRFWHRFALATSRLLDQFLNRN